MDDTTLLLGVTRLTHLTVFSKIWLYQMEQEKPFFAYHRVNIEGARGKAEQIAPADEWHSYKKELREIGITKDKVLQHKATRKQARPENEENVQNTKLVHLDQLNWEKICLKVGMEVFKSVPRSRVINSSLLSIDLKCCARIWMRRYTQKSSPRSWCKRRRQLMTSVSKETLRAFRLATRKSAGTSDLYTNAMKHELIGRFCFSGWTMSLARADCNELHSITNCHQLTIQIHEARYDCYCHLSHIR